MASTVLAQDDFSDPDSGWEHYNEFDGVLGYKGEGYRMFVDVPDSLFWVVKNETYQDVGIEIEAARTAGPVANLFGVMCRYSTDPVSFYAFLLSSRGTLGIAKRQDGELIWLESAEMQSSDDVLVDIGQVNHMSAGCEGEQLSLFVNGQFLMQITDSDSIEGEIGLMAGTVGESGTDILFDNMILTLP